MRKAVLLLLALVFIISAAACQASQPVSTVVADTTAPSESPSGEPSEKPAQSTEDIQITAAEQSVAGDAESVAITIKNVSDKDYTYGAMTSIETEKNGAWEKVETIADIMWIEIAYTIAPGQSADETVTLQKHYGTLAAGNYRFVKTFISEDGTNLTAYGPFTVK